jgi:YD repeat-containing protein
VVKENTMKNIFGTTDNLQLFDKENRLVYEFIKSSNGFSYETTCDSNGKELTYKDSNGFSSEYTCDSNGKVLTFKDSTGYSSEYTRDSHGKELTYKDSNGVSRGFDIPEYTMEELVEKLGNFKIKK